MTALFWILLIAALGAWWWQERQLLERAIAVARRACDRYQVQFLDQTAALVRRKWVRQGRGWVFERVFRFEFAVDGVERRAGWVRYLGHHPQGAELDLVVDADGAAPGDPADNVVAFSRRRDGE